MSLDTSKVTRFEIIDHSRPIYNVEGDLMPGKGRQLVFWDEEKQLELSIQDEGRTLKVFISDRKEKKL